MALQYPGKHKSFSLLVFSSLCFASLMSTVNATETVIYSEGFESSDGSYTHIGTIDKWEWGTPSPSFALGPSTAHSGSKCWGTDLDDTVPFGSNAYLTSPSITLPTLGANQVMRIRFFSWIAVDFMSDRGEFQVSSDGLEWETKAELLCTMQGGWNEYSFDISEYAGNAVYLRFRCYADNLNSFEPPTIPVNTAGLYIDDIAITVTDAPTIKKILTFEGNEFQNSIASCPWIYVQDGKNKKNETKYKQENDIYSTARGSGREYVDFYQLKKDLTANNGKFVFKLKETDQEESYTDLLHLILADHPASVDVACDENGNAFTYKKNQTNAPSTALDKNGVSVLSTISDADDFGYKAYNGDYIDLTFSWSGNVPHPIFLLKARGFVVDSMPGSPIAVQPKIEVQTQNSSGQWVTRNLFYPRWNSAFSGYDMAGLFPYAKKVRLLSSSCLTGKYNLLDWAVISTQNQKSVTITDLAPESAIRSDGINVAPALSAADGNRARMAASEEITLTFSEPSKANGNKRDFIVKSKGYYNPNGTFFFYTWNGSKWAQRDGWSIPLPGDQTHEFDLSLWLPDPAGKNRVRIWQDFIYDSAAIDYVGLRRDNVDLIMNYAIDLRDSLDSTSILNRVNVSDNQAFSWDFGEDWPLRDRWVEIGWTDTFVNTPPATNPVFVTNTNSPTPTINWTYHDLDGNQQNQYEIEVWSGEGGTGSHLWDPPVGQGTALSGVYAGQSLIIGRQYYARVKAFDGLNWGGWSEAAFTVSSNHPPAAEAGPDKMVFAVPSCLTSVELDGSASSDLDGDTLSFLWTGPFGTASGSKPAVLVNPGVFLIRLIVSDGKGGSGTDSLTIILRDTIPPIPDSASLPHITGECAVTITNPPTATDNCAGKIVGATDSLAFTTPGTHSILWRFNDGNGNFATQPQTIIVTDNTAPVPDAPTLPPLGGECFVTITNYPTATDNCAGQIVGTTTDPLTYSQKGTYSITWRYQDASGNSVTQPQTVTVTDQAAPIPDVTQLPAIQGNCSVRISSKPTATDNCKGRIIATTVDPLSYTLKGTYTIHWTYSDGNGNSSSQTQTVIVIDNTAPVPSVNPLPDITGYIIDGRCYTITSYPAAMDNCKGRIVGRTSSPLTYCYRGNFIVVWRYDDGNGNITTQNQNVYIR
jgi:hypothetical protein